MDVQFDERKEYNQLKVANKPMQTIENSSSVSNILQEDQVDEVMQEQDVKRSIRERTQSVRLNDYERFPN